jgi:YHS domain-containing protein
VQEAVIPNRNDVATSPFPAREPIMFKKLAATTVLSLACTLAQAGPQYVDESGYALSGYDAVAYHSLKQVEIGQQQPEAVPGKKSITAEFNGAIWAFSSNENRDKFVANPEKYAPQFDGHCAYGISQGGKVPANPNLWRIIDDKLYVNINPAVVGFFEEDIPGLLKTGNENWTAELESAEASDRSWKSMKANDSTYSTEAPL